MDASKTGRNREVKSVGREGGLFTWLRKTQAETAAARHTDQTRRNGAGHHLTRVPPPIGCTGWLFAQPPIFFIFCSFSTFCFIFQFFPSNFLFIQVCVWTLASDHV
jgi:hypothetical protein